MTTNYHTPYVDGTTKFRQSDMNTPLGELDAEITKRATTHQRSIGIVPFESDADVTAGDGKVGFTVPASMTAHDLKAALACVHTQGVTGTLDIQIRRRRAGADVDMLSTKITLGAEYYAADGVINATNDDIQTGDQIYVDVDAIHSGTAPQGLSVTLTFEPQ